MGYTHYWKFNQQPTPEKFTEFVEGAKQITATASEAGIPIGDEDYKSDYVRFNGVENGAHETFLVEFPVGDERYDDSWCKTAGKPYDTAVTACLILAKKLFDADFEVRSDGRWKDWEGGRLLYESVLNIEPKLEDFPNLGQTHGMIEWIALGVSLLAFSFSLKAYLDSKWIEIDWNFKDEDE